MADGQQERRKYKRLNAPVYCRPLGRSMSASQELPRLDVGDISMGGIRVYTDDKHKTGDRLELELFLPDGESITLDTTVVWVDELASGTPASFELGLKFQDVAEADRAKLEAVLKEA
ncbi:MAG: PilZ domain-containing protein [Myxococcaceae bacterium]|nr:PilZ domain-containing protein [Myxococcaceae bacterium]